MKESIKQSSEGLYFLKLFQENAICYVMIDKILPDYILDLMKFILDYSLKLK